MMADSIARQGGWFFRWRSNVLLGFVPLAVLAISRPEMIEMNSGELADEFYEGTCILLAFTGPAIRAEVPVFFPETERMETVTASILAAQRAAAGIFGPVRDHCGAVCHRNGA